MEERPTLSFICLLFIYLYPGLFPRGLKAASGTRHPLRMVHCAGHQDSLDQSPGRKSPMSERLAGVSHLTLTSTSQRTSPEVLGASSSGCNLGLASVPPGVPGHSHALLRLAPRRAAPRRSRRDGDPSPPLRSRAPPGSPIGARPAEPGSLPHSIGWPRCQSSRLPAFPPSALLGPLGFGDKQLTFA